MTGRAKPLVLAADDVRDIRQMVRAALSTEFDVILARNGEEAWELFNAYKPDLVITDMVMPRINGLELCQRIKLQSFQPHTPVIIVTAATKDREVADGLWQKASGSDAFVTKPFSPLHLLETARRVIAGLRAEADPAQASGAARVGDEASV